MRLRAATVTDGYKVGHGNMYADGTEKVYSNLTPRSDRIYLRNATKFYDGKLVFIGAQGAVQEIQEMWHETFFDLPAIVAVSEYARRMAIYLGGEVKATEQLNELHKLGYLPLEIKALPEGSKVKMGIPVMTITNTDSRFFWLVNYLETVISNLVWKPSTNATIAAEYKAICEHYGKLTGMDEFSISIQCHDFSMRGMSGPEDAARSGFAHLTSFIGTDTLPAMDYAEDYYDADPNSLIAISVPATEHAVATNNILSIEQGLCATPEQNLRLQAELKFMQDLITRKYPTGIVSYVADSFDFWSVVTDIVPALKEVILSREANGAAPGKLVIRPDSGDPVKVICGIDVPNLNVGGGDEDFIYDSIKDWAYSTINFDEDFDRDTESVDYGKYAFRLKNGEIVRARIEAYVEYDGSIFAQAFELERNVELTAEERGAVECLWETFGGTETSTGYKLLDSHIGLIYGDSITTKRAEEILRRLEERGFASGNVVFGVGSYTYQCNTRDTFGFAVKATYSEVSGVPVNIFKDPKTDSKKKSARGLLMVQKDADNNYTLTDEVDSVREASGYLTTIFKDGKWVKRTNLEEIRSRLVWE